MSVPISHRSLQVTDCYLPPVRHVYVHLPFCAHRCGYCDFVTVTGLRGQHTAYVDALLAELESEGHVLQDPQVTDCYLDSLRLETVYLGGGTPTLTEPAALARLLAALPPADEVTVEANPETVSSAVAALLREHGVNRVSLGVQSFRSHLLETLERRASPGDVRRAVSILREAGFDNVSLDLIYGIPGQSEDDLRRDLDDALALEPEHLSCYELEAKPGTRFTHAHRAELERQADAMEGYFERVVETLSAAGYRWYETANFCRPGRMARHNLAYWRGRDYLGIGLGAVSTVGRVRWRNAPSLARYVAALSRGEPPPREHEPLPDDVRRRERVMLGLRLDEPLRLGGLEQTIDVPALDRLERLGLAQRLDGALTLTSRGRFLGGAVTAELLA